MSLIKALRKDDVLLNDIEYNNNHSDDFTCWWLGQSGYLVQYKGYRLLIDPYLSDSLTQKYAATNKPHTRMSERAVDPAKLKGIGIVTSSHNHTDHLDAATLLPVLENNPGIKMIIPEANRAFVAERLKASADFFIGLNDGRDLVSGPFHFYGLPAAHNTIDRDEKGNCRCMGYIIRFGKWTIYHSGDTLLFDGLIDQLKTYDIDLAFLPINGDDPSRGVAGNFNAAEAVKVAKEAGIKCLVPCHYDMFTFNTADVNEFAALAKAAGQKYLILEIGGKIMGAELGEEEV
jgi:L-ascorbate metabolism protein UlaG (beta-lactamase superfamily)